MRSRSIRQGLPPVLALGLCLGLADAAGAGSYRFRHVEDFTSRQYCDSAATTALWDTLAGELRLPPFAPSLTGACDTPGYPWGVEVAGNLAYVADYDAGLQVIDITDPANPAIVGQCDTPGYAQDVTVFTGAAGRFAYVADGEAGIAIITVPSTLPGTCVLVGSVDTPGSACGVAVAGDRLFVADGWAGLRVLDISAPGSPVVSGGLETPGYARGLALDGDHAYLVDDAAGLQVIDISDPDHPALVWNAKASARASGIAVAGDRVYIADYLAGLQVYDISDPTHPTLTGNCPTPGHAWNVAVSGDWAYVADDAAGVQVIDIRDPGHPVIHTAFDTPSFAIGVAVHGERAYVCDQYAGLQVVDISAPLSMLPVGDFDNSVSAWAKDVVVTGNRAYVPYAGPGMEGLLIIDVSDPYLPVRMTQLPLTGGPQQVAVADNHAFLTLYDVGLLILDVSNPAMPTIVGSCDTPGNPRGIALAGDRAYVAAGTSLQVIDIADPTAPAVVGSLSYTAGQLAVMGDFAYLTAGAAGLHVVNISNPAAPVFVRTCNTPGSCVDVALDGRHAFVADGDYDLQVMSLADPSNPAIIGSLSQPGFANSVAVSGDWAFLVGEYTVLKIEVTNPAGPVLRGSLGTSEFDNIVAATVSGQNLFVAEEMFGHELKVVHFAQRGMDTGRDHGQSRALNSPIGGVSKYRLVTSHLGNLTYEISADGGASWQGASPDTAWHSILAAGDSLVWRSTHGFYGWQPVLNPTCHRVDLEWRYECAVIDSVVDAPDDGGGSVDIFLTRSSRDFADEGSWPLLAYHLFRRIDDATLKSRLAGEASAGAEAKTALPVESPVRTAHSLRISGLPLRALGSRLFLPAPDAAAAGFPPGTWEAVASRAAAQQDTYVCNVPTLADTSDGSPYSVYCVFAQTTTPSVWYVSPPDSGGSADNLPPAAPTGFIVDYRPTGEVDLSWDASPAEDFACFAIYRAATRSFEISPDTRIAVTAETAWTDLPEGEPPFHYLITAIDQVGNESLPAAPETGTDAGPPGAVRDLALHQNVPNPFNPATAIAFELTAESAVRLAVYDLRGRQVATLLDRRLAAGRHSVAWDGRDDRGALVAAGVYLCRLTTDGRILTRKMVLAR